MNRQLNQILKIERERRRLWSSEKPFVTPKIGAGHRGTVPTTIGAAVRKAATPMRKGLILRHLAKDKSALELGTGFGFGAAYIATTAKHLDTVDNEWDLSMDTDLFIGTQWGMKFEHALTEFKRIGKVYQFVHIDGDHTETATINNYLNVLRLMPNGGVIVFDDIYWSDGMKRAWKRIAFGQRHVSIFGMGILWLKRGD